MIVHVFYIFVLFLLLYSVIQLLTGARVSNKFLFLMFLLLHFSATIIYSCTLHHFNITIFMRAHGKLVQISVYP